LASSLKSLGTIAAQQALTAASSDPAAVSVIGSGAASPAAYTINSITSLATAASERSLSSYADSSATPVSSNGIVKLTVGVQNYQFTLTNNSLVGLRDKINSLGAGVTASILTTGNGNYLSLSANAAGATTLTLAEDPDGAATALLTNTNQGSDAKFKLNGIDVTQKSNLVNSVIPGATFQLLATSANPVTISLRTDRTQLASALRQFASDLDSVKAQVQAQTGKDAGLLSGSTVITGLKNIVRQITSYHGSSGSVKNLSDLGISFEANGKATFDQAAFDSLSDAQIANAFQFLGSATAGLGGFSAALRQYSDPISGLIKIEQDGIDRVDRSLQDQIAALTDRIDTMQAGLAKRLTAADSLAAALEAQQKSVTASLQGLSFVLYGRNQNT
jgi:flagellar hook-associated protein 2